MTMKHLLTVLLLSLAAAAQSPCGGTPVPGQPHVCVSWKASTTQGVSYNVYRATTSGGENYASPLNSTPLSVLFFNDTTDLVGTTYYYTACAVGTGGVLSPPSAEVSAQVPVPPNPPTSPAAAID
jgi:fibronectin type 3 domain-containing protein